jgi:hypothetical protein
MLPLLLNTLSLPCLFRPVASYSSVASHPGPRNSSAFRNKNPVYGQMSTPSYPSPSPSVQPIVRKVIRKAVPRPAVPSTAGLEQQPIATVIGGESTWSAPGLARRSTVDIGYRHQHGTQPHMPEMHRTSTATSVASSSGRSSLLSSNPPLSPLTDNTTPSPLSSPFQPEETASLDHAIQQKLAPPSYFALCAHCNGGKCSQDSLFYHP